MWLCLYWSKWSNFDHSKWSNFDHSKWSNFNLSQWSNLHCRVVLVKYRSKLLKISFSRPPHSRVVLVKSWSSVVEFVLVEMVEFYWSKWSNVLTYFKFLHISKKFLAFKTLKISGPECIIFFNETIFQNV